MLHLVYQAPIQNAVLERISLGDDVVFLENAVLGLLDKGRLSHALAGLCESCQLFVLSDELNARGVQADELVSGIEPIDNAKLVALAVKNTTIQTWS
ncbi:MAG: sulfurtransferase complex subunit TusB [Methylovulum sp.]|nr:sulfurtransferase complex subunit TusB [Methylovulum sp.]